MRDLVSGSRRNEIARVTPAKLNSLAGTNPHRHCLARRTVPGTVRAGFLVPLVQWQASWRTIVPCLVVVVVVC
jgi:hypothetical protein